MTKAKVKRLTPYERCLRRIPMCLVGGSDSEKTPSDFAWLALHELDLYDEGEDTEIRSKRERAVVARYMAFCLAQSKFAD